MNNGMITKEDERLVSLLETIGELSKTIENIVRDSKVKSGNGQYLTDRELSRLLKISRRSLQNYRTEGKIPFYRVGGKTLYRESDIEDFLANRYETPQTNERFTHI